MIALPGRQRGVALIIVLWILVLVTVAEFLCAILVLIGFKTRWASIPIVITMLVAALIQHAGDPFGSKEKSLLFLLVFVSILLLGPGAFSVDKK